MFPGNFFLLNDVAKKYPGNKQRFILVYIITFAVVAVLAVLSVICK